MPNINLSATGTNTTALSLDITVGTNHEPILFNHSDTTVTVDITGESNDVTFDTTHTFSGGDLTNQAYVVAGGSGVTAISFKLPAGASVVFRADNAHATDPQAVMAASGAINTVHRTVAGVHQLVGIALT